MTWQRRGPPRKERGLASWAGDSRAGNFSKHTLATVPGGRSNIKQPQVSDSEERIHYWKPAGPLIILLTERIAPDKRRTPP
jgi:hypothetical protein